MKRQLIACLLLIGPALAWAAGPDMDSIRLDRHDQASQQRGAQLYMNYCMGCHSLEYSRYQRVAEDLGIPEDLFTEHLILDPEIRIGELMTNNMSREDAKIWFGAAPPDLTLVARSRGETWLYNYLRGFYRDASRPWGVNNSVFPDVGMPHVLAELQGVQRCAPGAARGADGKVRRDPLTGEAVLYDDEGQPLNPCGSFELETEGSMKPAEFDEAMYDLVNFMAYVAEPARLDRQRLGVYVLLFLGVLFVFAWLLNREYWKDVPRNPS